MLVRGFTQYVLQTLQYSSGQSSILRKTFLRQVDSKYYNSTLAPDKIAHDHTGYTPLVPADRE